jgi:hypothetical protein
LVSPALQRGEMGFHKFIREPRRDAARTLSMQKLVRPELWHSSALRNLKLRDAPESGTLFGSRNVRNQPLPDGKLKSLRGGGNR